MELAGWRKYSLPHIIYHKYASNEISGYTRFSGDSFFLAHISDEPNIAEAVLMFSWFLTLFILPFNWLIGLMMLPVFQLSIAISLALIDSYCKIKFRRRIKFKNTVDWILDPDNHKKRRPWDMR